MADDKATSRAFLWLIWGVLVGGAGLFAAAYGLTELDVLPALALAVVIVLGVVVLLLIVVAMAAVLQRLGVAPVSTEAFGLPTGSIRAILALALVLVFVVVGIYVIGTDTILKDDAARSQAAIQLLSMVGTLAVTVAAFYFGTNAVKAGVDAVAAIGDHPQPPGAENKGAEPASPSGWNLIGYVTPNGLVTRWYFEYGADKDLYGKSTAVMSTPGTADRQRVEVVETQIKPGDYYRIVAFNERGTAIGAPPDQIPADSGEGGSSAAAKPKTPDEPSAASPDVTTRPETTRPDPSATPTEPHREDPPPTAHGGP